jgi:ribulose-5-phosphate 4-epimerase/fuculose-1-phosphate aldolase
MPEIKVEDLKIQLVKAVRMLEKIQLLDMNGHVSCRVPGTDRFLINARKASRASLTVEDVVICNLDGSLVGDSMEPPSESFIHNAIYQRRQDVTSIIHGHPHWQTVLGIADISYRPVFGIGAFVQHVNVYEKASLINIPEMGEEVAEALGNDRVVHLRNHGNVVVGEDIQTAFTTAVYVEENAKKQYHAALLGPNLKVLEGENLARTIETSWSPSIVQKVWRYYEEKSEKEGALHGVFGQM